MIKFPFTTLQQCNLDWIMQQLHKILDFMPLNGSPGDVLQRNADGAAWMPIAAVSMDIHGLDSIADVSPADELPIYDNSMQGNYKVTVSDLLDTVPVQSVNGMTGDVTLDAVDVGALPDTTVIPDSTSDLVNDSGFVDAAGAAAAAPVQSVNGLTGAVTIPLAPVYSVNGRTGTVVLDANAVGALPNTYVAPVTSVNGQTGDVVITPGGTSYTLLWTNSAPTSSFPGQVISQNLSQYVFIVIEYAIKYLDIHTAMFYVPDLTAPTGWSVSDVIWGIATTGGDKYLVERSLSISTSAITFDNGIRIDAYNSSNTVDNTYCRPTRIWGIK